MFVPTAGASIVGAVILVVIPTFVPFKVVFEAVEPIVTVFAVVEPVFILISPVIVRAVPVPMLMIPSVCASPIVRFPVSKFPPSVMLVAANGESMMGAVILVSIPILEPNKRVKEVVGVPMSISTLFVAAHAVPILIFAPVVLAPVPMFKTPDVCVAPSAKAVDTDVGSTAGDVIFVTTSTDVPLKLVVD